MKKLENESINNKTCFFKRINYDIIMQFLLGALCISFFISKSHNVVGGLVVLVFLFQVFRTKNFSIFKDKIFIFLSLWCLYLALSVIWAVDKSRVVSSAFVIFVWSLLYLALKTTLNTTEKIEKFFKFSSFVILFVCFNAVFQSIFGFNLFGTPLTAGRATDLFSVDRIFPFVLPIFIGVFGAFLSLKNRDKSFYILNSLALFAILLALPVSGIRGPLVILAVFLPIIAWVSSYRKFAFAGLGILAIVLGIIVANNEMLQSRLATLKNPFEDQKHLRVAIWKTAFEMFKDNPVLGVGYKNFRDREFEYYKPEFESYEIKPETGDFAHHTHSPWLDILAEQGLVGFCFLLWLFGFVFYNAFKKGAFVFVGSFSVLYAFSFLNSSFVLSSSRWAFFMILSVAFYAIMLNYYEISNDKQNG